MDNWQFDDKGKLITSDVLFDTTNPDAIKVSFDGGETWELQSELLEEAMALYHLKLEDVAKDYNRHREDIALEYHRQRERLLGHNDL